MPELLDANKFVLSFLLFSVTNVIVWFQLNGYRISEFLDKHQVLVVLVTAIPIGLGYFYAWKLGFEGVGSFWSVRLLGFGSSYLAFPILTHLLLNESMFTPKIITGVGLSFLIVFIQIFWPENKIDTYKSQEQNESLRKGTQSTASLEGTCDNSSGRKGF